MIDNPIAEKWRKYLACEGCKNINKAITSSKCIPCYRLPNRPDNYER